jgi:hypothetical protein
VADDWDDFVALARGGDAARVRVRLRRIRSALESGDAIDADDAGWLRDVLASIDCDWPDPPPARPGEASGRLLAQAFGLRKRAGRRGIDQRTIREEKRRIAMARDVILCMEQGATYAEAVAMTAYSADESTVKRAYRDHREFVQMQRTMVREIVKRDKNLP